MLTLANRLLNMLFCIEIWPNVPPNLHYQLAINQEVVTDNNLSVSQCLHGSQPRKQQHTTIQAIKLASVMSQENGCCVNDVYRYSLWNCIITCVK